MEDNIKTPPPIPLHAVKAMIHDRYELHKALEALCKAKAHQADTGEPIPSDLWFNARFALDNISMP